MAYQKLPIGRDTNGQNVIVMSDNRRAFIRLGGFANATNQVKLLARHEIP